MSTPLDFCLAQPGRSRPAGGRSRGADIDALADSLPSSRMDRLRLALAGTACSSRPHAPVEAVLVVAREPCNDSPEPCWRRWAQVHDLLPSSAVAGATQLVNALEEAATLPGAGVQAERLRVSRWRRLCVSGFGLPATAARPGTARGKRCHRLHARAVRRRHARSRKQRPG